MAERLPAAPKEDKAPADILIVAYCAATCKCHSFFVARSVASIQQWSAEVCPNYQG